MEYLKWSAKSLWGLVAPFAIMLINDNREWIEQWAAGAVASLLTFALVWLQTNAPDPR